MSRKISLKSLVLILLLLSIGSVVEAKVVVSIEGFSVSDEAFESYVRINQAEEYSYYSETYKLYGMDSIPDDFWSSEVIDLPENMDIWVAEIKTQADYFKNSLVSSLINMLILEKHSVDYDIKLSGDEEEKIREVAKEFTESNDLSETGISEEGIYEYLRLYLISQLTEKEVLNSISVEVPEDEAKQSSVYIVPFRGSDFSEAIEEEGYDSKRYADIAKNAAKSFIKALTESGSSNYTDIQRVVSVYDESTQLYEAVFGESNNDFGLSDAILKAARGLKDGEVYSDVIEEDGVFYVVIMNKGFDVEETEKMRTYLISEKESAEYGELLSSWLDLDRGSVKVDKRYISRISISDCEVFTVKKGDAS